MRQPPDTPGRFSDLRENQIVHVFGEHAHLEIGERKVRYIAPERIQGDKIVRVVRRPERVDLHMPDVVTAPVEKFKKRKDGRYDRIDLDRYTGHVFADDEGTYAADLNDWEQQVIQVESGRPDFVAWYRNPSTAKGSALRIAYPTEDSNWKSLQPDFIVPSQLDDGSLVTSIVDPHGDYLSDALPKLRALADYAETYAHHFHRVEALSKIDDEMRLLDMTEPETRTAVRDYEGPKATGLYTGAHSRRYE